VFEKDDVYAMFANDPAADALRIYYGAHEGGEPTIVLICAQMNVDNMLARNSTSSGGPRQWPTLKGSRSSTSYTEFDIHNDPIY
jgi:hypothetical protein